MLSGMSKLPPNPMRVDPYKNFKFRMKMDGKIVAGISKVSGLKRSSDPVSHNEGAGPKSPSRTKYEPITLERGLTQDRNFADWANSARKGKAHAADKASLGDLRKDVRIELYNEAGQVVEAYHLHRCWVSEYQSLPELDAGANSVAIEHMKLENEGWERDMSVVKPTQL